MPNTTAQQYELTFILDERAGATEGRAKTDELRSYIEEHSGSITSEELWGRRELAYPIKKSRTGFYVTLVFGFPTEQVSALEQHLRFDESVIRSLVTKAYAEAQPGSLYPQVEEQQEAKRDDKPSGEEQLRRSSGTRPQVPAADEEATETDALPEEERRKQVDETLDQLLRD